ncbi:MAG TPA: nucleotidyltransferase domain-containing protein, partial [Anaerolineae bacterium]
MTTTTEGISELARRLPRHLAPNERLALQALVERLHLLYGDNLLRVVLFGSKARGDFDDESDLDVLVVVRIPTADYWTHRKQISEAAYELELEH